MHPADSHHSFSPMLDIRFALSVCLFRVYFLNLTMFLDIIMPYHSWRRVFWPAVLFVVLFFISPVYGHAFIDKSTGATFAVPAGFAMEEKGHKITLKGKNGALYITFQSKPTKGTRAKTLAGSLAESLKKELGATVMPLRKVQYGGLNGYQFGFQWKMKSQPLQQEEVTLEDGDIFYTFSLITTPLLFPEAKVVFRKFLNGFKPGSLMRAKRSQKHSVATGSTNHAPPPRKLFGEEQALLSRFNQDPTVKNAEALARFRASKAFGLLGLAEKNRDDEAFELAMAYAESAIQLVPSNMDYRLLLASLYFHARAEPSAGLMAEAALSEILEKDPGNSKALLMLSQLLYEQGHYSESIDYLEKLSARHPGKLTAAVMSMAAAAYALAGENERGIQFFQDLVEKDPANFRARLGLAILLQGIGATRAAGHELQAVLRAPGLTDRHRLYARQLIHDFKVSNNK